ncbi:MAG: hypothetical protein GY903_30550 [Fuerstiella sp.]|nr:hypothetical protein [Fuerstiella sp.]
MMTNISVPCSRLPAPLSIVATIAVASVIFCSSAAADEATDFKGSFELPNIVRFTELPRRMYLEPELSFPPNELYVRDEVVKLAERILVSGPDNEIRIEAIQTLQRLHVEGLADASHLAESFRKQLGESTNIHVRQACASALATIGHAESAKDVAQMCRPQFEALCLEIEPNFASWGDDALKATWLQRVEAPGDYSTVMVRLASEGLAQLNDAEAITALESILNDTMADYGNRHSAARAIGLLDQQQAAATADIFSGGGVADRLLACALLEHCATGTGVTLLAQLCDDDSNAVAARAWETMLKQDPEQLNEKLDVGVSHPESNVRFVAIQTLRLFPTEHGCQKLHVLAGDIHIGVRNSARQVLTILADTKADLRNTILQNAGGTLSDPEARWQQQEQSMVMLGQLGHREWQRDCLGLLEHDRPEVYVTAAWLLHLMPQHDIAEQVGETTMRRYELLQSARGESPPSGSLRVQLTFLFQHSGFTELKSLQGLCSKQFSNKDGGDPEKRAAGLWALGKINKGNPDPNITGKLIKRIFDDNPMLPEYDVVRRMSVLALVWMHARSTVPDMHRIREKYGAGGLLGETARWALPQFGEEQPPAFEPLPIPVQDFPISPL